MSTDASRLVSRRDLEFLLYEILDVAALARRERFAEHSRETFDAALDLSAGLAARYFAPHNKLSDRTEPSVVGGRVRTIPEVKEALAAFAGAGLFAAAEDYELGGMQLPSCVAQACYAHFDAANIATTAYAFLTIAAANLVKAYGDETQKRLYLEPLLAGRFFGTMCLSETEAGSSLADIRTVADPQSDGTYRITGTKMWISGGDHELAENIVHLVLARIRGAPAGAKGISLFIVPKRHVGADGVPGAPNDIVLAGLNHKMGYRGTTNCVLSFGDSGNCTGHLVGRPHAGLAQMFHMMNEARIVVGRGATMLGYAGYMHALDYARVRRQGRRPGGKNPGSPPVSLIEHADIRRMLLAQKAYVEGGLALSLVCALLVDDAKTHPDATAREEAGLLLEVLTPVAKAWPSQWCLKANDLAIQVHGGYGYTREFPVEQLYRDNRLNPIHEGTNGIQAIDLLGRKVGWAQGRALSLLVDRMNATCAEADVRLGPRFGADAAALRAAVEKLIETTRVLREQPDVEAALANASVYLEAFGHTVVAWLWLRQALAAQEALDAATPADADFYRGKLQAAAYFFAWELPRTEAQHDLLRSLDCSALDMRDAWY